MKLSWRSHTLKLKVPWRLAHDVSETRENFIVSLGTGHGEAPGVAYYGDTPQRLEQYFASVNLTNTDDPHDIDGILSRLPPGSRAARAACDIALHDYWGQILGQPLYRLFGLNPDAISPTSFTIAIDAPEVMAERAISAALPILKLKLGGGNDDAIVQAVRAVSNSTLRVDANAAWTVEEAAGILPRLSDYEVELVEQPLRVGDMAGLAHLRNLGQRPKIFVDESVVTMADIVAHAGLVDGVVIKLAKSGGIREAIRQITVAKALGLEVMLSCMVETSIGVTAAAHIAPLADLIDLDGPLLINNDSCIGISYEGARIRLPSGPGLGIRFE